jgi:hypothetical protein
MIKIKTETLAQVFEEHYKTKIPMMVFGSYGVGKSEICRQSAEKIAASQNKQFVNWAHTNNDEKLAMINEPEKYFVFCDQRISQMDSTDLRGIPNMMNKEMLETIPMSWVIYFTRPKASGYIFFDEINLAAPVVAGSAYQIIHDRAISDRKLADDVFLCAAGNRQTDKAYTFEMPAPLRDRFSEYEVEPDYDSWSKWASNKVNPHIISFLGWKDSYLFKVSEKNLDKGSTPRGWYRASIMMGEREISDSTFIMMLIAGAVGEAAALEFKAYVKHHSQLDWKKIYKNPEIIKEFSVDKIYAIVGGIGEQFNKLTPKDKNIDERVEEIIGVLTNLEPEFVMLVLRMIGQGETFRKNFMTAKSFTKFAQKNLKYLV